MGMDRINALTEELRREIELESRAEVVRRLLGTTEAPAPVGDLSPSAIRKGAELVRGIGAVAAVVLPAKKTRRKKAGPLPSPSSTPAKKVSAKSGGGVRYGLDEAKVLDVIKEGGTAGRSAEAIRAVVGGSSGALSRQIKKLLVARRIKKAGKLRGTRYFVR